MCQVIISAYKDSRVPILSEFDTILFIECINHLIITDWKEWDEVIWTNIEVMEKIFLT